MFQHFIVTFFSCRISYLSGRKGQDPLNPKRLRHRFDLFKMVCLPSILSQENQDFVWVILIDQALPLKYKNELEQLIASRPGTYLVEYYFGLPIYSLQWLKIWIKPGTDHIMTTRLDDDDGISVGFTRYLADHANHLIQSGKHPPLIFYSCGNNLSWDLWKLKKADLGYVKPYGFTNQPPSNGFSISCRYPEINLSIFSFSHHSHHLLNESQKDGLAANEKVTGSIGKSRKLLHELASKSNFNWDGKLYDENFHHIISIKCKTLVTNHADNIEISRIFSNSSKCTPVNKHTTFPEFSINFSQAESYFAKSSSSVFAIINLYFRILYFIPSRFKDKSIVFRMKQTLFDVWQLSKHIRKLK